MPTVKRLKRGDVREDGKVFWKYQKTAKDGEYWMSPSKFEGAVVKHRAHLRRAKGWEENRLYDEMTDHAKRISGSLRGKEIAKCEGRLIVNRLKSRMHREAGKQLCADTSQSTGISVAGLRHHIESQFQEGMSWENYGKWHVDHIKPISLFNLLDPTEREAANHFTNLQPLWAEDNLKKGSRFS